MKSQQTACTQGSVLMRTARRKARWVMLSAAAALLQKGHVDAHGKDITEDPLGKKTASYTSITFNLQSELCSAIAND